MNDIDRENQSEIRNPQSEIDEPIELEITDSIDLHAFAPRDVKAVTIAYLEEARKKGFKLVRIIHGKGIGVQREAVRKVLENTPFVRSFKTADEFSGSWGATIVTFHD
ncbi:MAG: Smr/MutS family protein [Acidobacteria bacterium]|nr:Smr/MutS family protein [Acidobacteriota bacterium]